MAAFDRHAARFLTLRYVIALGTVALLTIAAQVVVQWSLARQEHDAAVVNLAGRQRMLSQRLTKAALAWQRAEPGARDRWQGELDASLDAWLVAHRRLHEADDLPGAGRRNSAAVAVALAGLDATVADMTAAVRNLAMDATALDRLLAGEAVFLPRMEAVVGMYHAEAAERVAWTRRLELGLCVGLLAVLVAEVVWVFRPAVRRLRRAMRERERLREREAIDREQAASAQAARDIGQDLHDGMGQQLTALSFQARALELDSTGPARVRAAALHAGVTAAIAQVRGLARRLAPVDVHAAGLEGALRQLADATSRAAGVACSVEWQADLPAPIHAQEDLYRIAQEAITNTLRHGHARRIAVTWRREDGGAAFVITDDGTVPVVAMPEGVGTRAMRARAERAGGRYSAGPLPSGGWHVRIALPAEPAP